MTSADELVRRAQKGDVDAFTELVRILQGRVRAYVGTYLSWHDLTDDVAQEVFIDAFRSIASFRGDGGFDSWVLGIARHRVLLHLRRHNTASRTFERLLHLHLCQYAGRDIPDQIGSEGHLAGLERCVRDLPPHSAALVRAHYFEGRSLVDIARAQGAKEGTIRVTLLRIRQALRACMDARLRAAEGES